MPGAGNEIAQVAAVVHDVEERMEAYRRAFGWEPWRIYELAPPLVADSTASGVPVETAMTAAIVFVGEIQFELLQPHGPGPLQDFLDSNGEGLHHILVRSQSGEDGALDAGLAALDPEPPLLDGAIGPGLRFAYRDLSSALGIVVETLQGVVDDELPPTRIYPPTAA
jgi:Glyoxalase/Bleomycin resistance protein/Dioxygenase superfamily